ncbi:MAG: hypothetical protein JWM88_2297 [Verrucomicrobia bacterium]|nr:hypothetical protein [Verrucomicrobiota bacterium]
MTPMKDRESQLIRELETQRLEAQTRRHFLRTCATGMGAMFLSTMANRAFGSAELDFTRPAVSPLAALPPQFAAKARRVIYLHMAGGPSQLELFEHKPDLEKLNGQDCPQSFLAGKRFAFITGTPKMLGPQAQFHQAGKSGTWLSDRLPHLERCVDDLCFIRSMRTDQFNHAPAQLLMQTGSPRLGGGASLGSWVTYGLGTENQNLPGFIVLVSGGKTPDGGKSLWSSNFLPSVYQGVQCRAKGDPVLYLSNPAGVSRGLRREVLDAIEEADRQEHAALGDPETLTRIAQYEMAFRMQISASDAMDLRQEPPEMHAKYGTEVGKESFANNCLLARRLAERGVRFIQLYHWGWDSHGSTESEALNLGFHAQCRQVDQPIAALLEDLKGRGMLEDTLVVWGGEFGRTPMQENRGGQANKFIGRDHHPGAFTIWMAGGGVKPGFGYGETDAVGYDIVENPVEVRDLHATILHQLGFDHRKLNFRFQGLDQKITGVKPAKVIRDVLA